MKKIELILEDCIKNKKLKMIKFDNRKIIIDGKFYQISIFLNQDKTLSMSSKWNFGIIGSFIFNKKYAQKDNLYQEIKDELIKNDFQLDEMNLAL